MLALLRWLAPWLLKAGAAMALLLGFWATIRHVDHKARAEQREIDRAATALAQSRQTSADLRRAAATERERADITKEKDDALASDLADARARAAARGERLRGETAEHRGSRADLSAPPEAAPIADGPGADTLVHGADLDVCIENTVRLDNARSWYREQEKVTG
jgi:hypothetical protein